MIWKFFDTSCVNDLTKRVVTEIRKFYPPKPAADEAASARERTRIIEHLRRQAPQWTLKSRMNIYQKAKLGVQVEDALIEAGYAPLLSKAVAQDLVELVALDKSRS
jgi:hypothetical protein